MSNSHDEPVRLCFVHQDGTTTVQTTTRFLAQLELEAMYHPGVVRAYIEQIEAPKGSQAVRLCNTATPDQQALAVRLCYAATTGAGSWLH